MTRPMDVVRARDPHSGDHYTTTRHLATKRGATVLEDRPAVDQYGRWLPPLPHKTIQPARDDHGRGTSTADSGEATEQPHAGEEEA